MTPELAKVAKAAMEEMSTRDLVAMRDSKPPSHTNFPPELFNFIKFNIPKILANRPDLAEAEVDVLWSDITKTIRKIFPDFPKAG